MSESAQHLQLVNQVINEVISIVGACNKCFIMSDVADGYGLPHLTEEGFRPDVFYQYGDQLIIGEAKTSNDVAKIHSKLQYESYIKKCAIFPGNALFIVAVPWTEHAVINNILRKLQIKYPGHYIVRILDGVGGMI